ncbi:hypothetical protein QR680_009775 [Steinernema hermaphroditum]|uniref:Growth hormone-inducible transmembrane protein n=1 Tax=Steinernema hermaphroditum TaxID=289476 RepID=A0AA39IMX5_9BILA|nr:hypothetical protein QR680_009775 [Steinernema hermaphroditum]
MLLHFLRNVTPQRISSLCQRKISASSRNLLQSTSKECHSAQWNRFFTKSNKVAEAVLAGAGAFGIGSLCYYGLQFHKGTSTESIVAKSPCWSQEVRDRIGSTYLYLMGSLGICAVSTFLGARSPLIMRMATSQNFGVFASLVGIGVGLALLNRFIPKEHTVPKHLAWVAFPVFCGLISAPLTALGESPALQHYSTLYWGRPALMSLTTYLAVALPCLFIPPLRPLLIPIDLPLTAASLIIFNAFLLYDTQKVVKRAETYPDFDPIAEQVSIFLDVIIFFYDICTLIDKQIKWGGKGGRRRR